jgi:hypothetical protein
VAYSNEKACQNVHIQPFHVICFFCTHPLRGPRTTTCLKDCSVKNGSAGLAPRTPQTLETRINYGWQFSWKPALTLVLCTLQLASTPAGHIDISSQECSSFPTCLGIIVVFMHGKSGKLQQNCPMLNRESVLK